MYNKSLIGLSTRCEQKSSKVSQGTQVQAHAQGQDHNGHHKNGEADVVGLDGHAEELGGHVQRGGEQQRGVEILGRGVVVHKGTHTYLMTIRLGILADTRHGAGHKEGQQAQEEPQHDIGDIEQHQLEGAVVEIEILEEVNESGKSVSEIHNNQKADWNGYMLIDPLEQFTELENLTHPVQRIYGVHQQLVRQCLQVHPQQITLDVVATQYDNLHQILQQYGAQQPNAQTDFPVA